ncbi:MAG: hypothetical protein A2014_03820 [Spirochaetes bacterium GWF1_49_6]|nr:MAG: hypothetical protein A2014_03820 [Spirochaetes bacterium GWF1_49_6]
MKTLIGIFRYILGVLIVLSGGIGFSFINSGVAVETINRGIGFMLCTFILTIIVIATFIIPYLKVIKDNIDEKK